MTPNRLPWWWGPVVLAVSVAATVLIVYRGAIPPAAAPEVQQVQP